MRTYTVKPGDCLSEIALQLTGRAHRWMELARVNQDRLPKGPHLIHPGDQLVLPSDWPEPVTKPVTTATSCDHRDHETQR